MKFQNQQKYAALIWGVVVLAQSGAQAQLLSKSEVSLFLGYACTEVEMKLPYVFFI